MNLLYKIRVLKYYYKKDKVEEDIRGLVSLKNSIESYLKSFSSCKEKLDNFENPKSIIKRDNLFETLRQMISNYESKINSFRNKYLNWSLNCKKLNSKNYFNEEYKDIYSEAIIEHTNNLKRLVSHFTNLYELYGYTNITTSNKSKAIFR